MHYATRPAAADDGTARAPVELRDPPAKSVPDVAAQRSAGDGVPSPLPALQIIVRT